MNEEQLIEGCKKNDRLAQKELYAIYSRKMMGVCMRYVGNKEVAQDTVQEGFIKVFSNINAYSGEGSLSGWIRKIFVNCSLEYLRKSDVLHQSIDIDKAYYLDSGDHSIIATMSAAELMELIERLPTGFRTVFNLYAIEGYSHKEISDLLQITESTSRSQLTRAKQLLQRQIKTLNTI